MFFWFPQPIMTRWSRMPHFSWTGVRVLRASIRCTIVRKLQTWTHLYKIINLSQNTPKQVFANTRPKPPYGRQGLAGSRGKDAVWRVKFSFRRSWPQLTSMIKKRYVTNTGPNRPPWLKKRYVTNTGPNRPQWLKKRYVTNTGPQLTSMIKKTFWH